MVRRNRFKCDISSVCGFHYIENWKLNNMWHGTQMTPYLPFLTDFSYLSLWLLPLTMTLRLLVKQAKFDPPSCFVHSVPLTWMLCPHISLDWLLPRSPVSAQTPAPQILTDSPSWLPNKSPSLHSLLLALNSFSFYSVSFLYEIYI